MFIFQFFIEHLAEYLSHKEKVEIPDQVYVMEVLQYFQHSIFEMHNPKTANIYIYCSPNSKDGIERSKIYLKYYYESKAKLKCDGFIGFDFLSKMERINFRRLEASI